MFDAITLTLASAVADNGTFTVGYPTGRGAGDYVGSRGHYFMALGAKYVVPNDATLAFGASSVTVTYTGATTLPAGTTVRFHLERVGQNDRNPDNLAEMADNMVLAPAVLISLGAPDVADADGFCASQNLTSAGVFSSSVTAAAAIAAAALGGTADVPRNVVAAWTGTAVLTVTGKDVYGATLVESSGSGTSFTGKKAFKTVTDISVSGNVTSLTVGTGDVLGLPVRVAKVGQVLAEFQDGVQLSQVGNRCYLSGKMLEAAVDAGTSYELVSPVAGNIVRLSTICLDTITTGGAITVEVNTVAVNGLSVVVADSSTTGDVDTDTATPQHASTVVAVGDRIEIIPAAAFNASTDLTFVLEIECTKSLNGTFVAAVDSTATATTGDVRGTYDPPVACDGAIGWSLLTILPDPRDKGVSQYAG